MTLRTFTYSGGKWTGTVTFCGVSLDVEVQCVGGSWSVKVNGQATGYSVHGMPTIGGTVYYWFSVAVNLVSHGINTNNCSPPGAIEGSFAFYLPWDGDDPCGG